METFLIFDGNALLHRAFHALPPLKSPDGRLVNAVYGFLSMFLSVLKNQQPVYWAVAFDMKGPTFRDKIYADYKAKRIKPPQNFYDQIPIVKEILRQLEVPILEQSGYEADDLIGSLAAQLPVKRKDVFLLVVTNDRDMFQLINHQVAVLTFEKNFHQIKIWQEKEVKAYFGFSPAQIVDFKALRGDPSDNLPGVTGVGFKTAQRLIQCFGDLKAIYRQLKEVEPPSVREKLVKGKKAAFLSYRLALIRRDLKINFSFSAARVHDFNSAAAEKAFLRWGFKSLLKRLPVSWRKNPLQASLF